MAGRPPTTKTVGLHHTVYLPVYLLKYQPLVKKYQRRTYFDGQKKIKSPIPTICHGITIYKKHFPEWKAHLEKQDWMNIRGHQMTTELPVYCMKCGEKGIPHFRALEKVASGRDINFKKPKKIKYKVYYNHSKPKSRQCFIGYWLSGSYQLAKGIHPRAHSPFFHHKGEVPFTFQMPEKKAKRAEILT